MKWQHNAHSNQIRNQNFPVEQNGWCQRQQKVIKLLVKFNNFAKKPFKIASRVHYETKKIILNYFVHFQILIICRSAILKFQKSSCTKDSSEFFHAQSISAIYYIKRNQTYKHLCFRKCSAWTSLLLFVHTVLDLL